MGASARLLAVTAIVLAAPASALLEAPPTHEVWLKALQPLAWEPAPQAAGRLAALAGATPATAGMPAHEEGAPDALQARLAPLHVGLRAAGHHVAHALADLVPGERAALLADARAALAAAEALGAGLGTDADRARVEAHRAVADQVDLAHLAAAQGALLQAAHDALPRWSEARDLPQLRSHCATGTVVFEAPDCSVIVGGAGANTYTLDARLLVDLGGADTYLNNAGGAMADVALLLDLGVDDDTYASVANAGEAVQGAAVAGAGLLVDAGGDDTYTVAFTDATATGRVVAQGAAFAGAGALWDLGGDDLYTSRNVAQGAALSGLGLLLDESGGDVYTIVPTFDSEVGQGAACFGGVGALLDRGSGDDTYTAAVDDMQGFGCAGALGLLLDGGGSDEVELQRGPGEVAGMVVSESGFGQGYGELGGIAGILLDLGGDDDYLVESAGGAFEGWQAQGVGNLGTPGMLLDLGGHDTYTARERVQGWGGFGGEGVLLDALGNDAYSAQAECLGWGVLGVGLLLDLSGGDTYACPDPPDVGTRGDGQAWTAGSGAGLDA